jgi:lipopolysaccharide export system permease protein
MLIERYIALRVVKMALAAILPVLAVIWIIQVLARINLVTDSGQSIGSFATLAALILPTILPLVIPFGIVIGVSQTLAAMNADSELAVIDAAGASRSILLRPVIFIALAASVISFGVDNFVEPVVRVQARKMIASVYADLLSSVIEEKSFRKIENGLYIQISKRVQGRVLRGLFVADYRDPQYQLIYYAKEGAVDSSGTTLVMRDGEVDRRTPDGNLSVVKFASYAFDLSELTHARGQTTLRAIDRDLPFLFHPDPNDDDVKNYSGDYRAELHRRLTEWTFPLVYGLLAYVLAGRARTQREIRNHPVIISLTLAFLLRWLSFYFSNEISTNPVFIVPLYLLPIVVGCGSIYLIFRARALRLPALFSLKWLVDMFRRQAKTSGRN